jgi:D-serine deaminase-like pyridoxal phosphate-dependent protein
MNPIERLDPELYRLPPEELERTLSPALVVYLDRVRHNIAVMRGLLDGDLDRWRPHIKTSKIPEVYRLLAEAGVRAFKCATTREAEQLLAVLERETDGEGDLLAAYTMTGPGLKRLAELASRHLATRISVLVEDPEAVSEVPESLSLFIDLNVGMDRSGTPPEDTRRLLATARRAGQRLRGLHAYEGQIDDPDPNVRDPQAVRSYERLLVAVESLRREAIPVEEIVTSGTPTFRNALGYAPIHGLGETWHRVSPGTLVYHDLRSMECLPELDFQPAALVLSRTVSRPAADRITCDAGSKAVAAEVPDPVAGVLGRPGLVAERPSEEHLPMRVESGPPPDRGEVLLLVPRHVCPTVNLAEQALLVERGRVVDLVPVAARAHDTRPAAS